MPTSTTTGDGPAEATRRAATVADLRTQFILFKRTLQVIRTGSELHHSVTPAGVPLLGALRRLGPQRTTAIAAEFCLDPSTVSRQVDGLLRSGHVEKVRDPADGRAWLVQLTDAGQQALHDHLESIGGVLQDLLDDWTAEDLHTFTTLLGRLNDDVLARFVPEQPPANTPAPSPEETL